MFGKLFSKGGETKSPPSTTTAPEAVTPAESSAAPEEKRSWTQRLKAGLSRTRGALASGMNTLLLRGRPLDDELLDELETLLIAGDVGVKATHELIAQLKLAAREKRVTDGEGARVELKRLMLERLQAVEKPLDADSARPFVIMTVGVNGAGKTTTLGKLAKYFQSQGKRVMLAAGDTFRAAAREQLAVWAERNDVPIFLQDKGDAAAVIFDAVQSARAREFDVLLADTAGRLPTQLHLMEEIKKVKRVITKADASAPHETLLVLDANTGQNAIAQVRAFHQALGLTGLILTKLDGTAKGGVMIALAAEFGIPVRFIGVGEGLDDMRPFVARDFVDALFD